MSTEMTKPVATSKAVAKFDYNVPAKNGAAGLQEMAKPLVPQIAAALPKFLAQNAERMVRALLTECAKSPKLLDCTPKSLFGGVIQVAALGLELGGPAGQAYLIPFGREAQLVVGYKGFITLAYRAGVKRFTPRVVREGDSFSISYGTRNELIHTPKLPPDGAITGYYAVVETPTGGVDFEYLSKAQAEEHKARYALSQKGPWATSFDEMSLKTCIRKLAKRVPLSVEWVAAAGLDEQADEGVPQQLGASVVLEGEQAERPAGLRERLEAAKKPVAAGEPGVGPDENVQLDEDGNPVLFGSASGEAPKH